MEGGQRIAVVGSGIAGLSAAWLLSHRHDVTLIERFKTLGMDARSIDLGDQRIDVPLRVFYPGYYPQLSKLYRHTQIDFESVDYGSSFSELSQSAYFRYGNFVRGEISVPYVSPSMFFRSGFTNLLGEVMRFFKREPAQFRNGKAENKTITAYLKERDYSDNFIHRFILPAMAGIGTCSYSAASNYPADVVVDYFSRGLFFTGVRRVKAGTRDVVTRLTNNVSKLILGHQVESISPASDGVHIKLEGQEALHFHHVVLATQANQALDLVAPSFTTERAILEKFPYESSRVTMHCDPALAPRDQRDWAPVNFILESGQSKPMATIWMNRVQPALRNSPDVFQTWNPIVEPQADKLLAEAKVERPIVTGDSVKAIKELRDLRHRRGSRLWVTGSYAQWGIPLLEAAVVSAIEVSESLGVNLPWH